MHPVLRIFGIFCVFAGVTVAWLILGGVTGDRTRSQSNHLGGAVVDLWGAPQTQVAPALAFEWQTQREQVREETDAFTGRTRKVREVVWDAHSRDVSAASAKIDVGLHLDQRLKGLVWYSLYDVDFEGAWTYVHRQDEAGYLRITYEFPASGGIYDGFRFIVSGKDHASELKPVNDKVNVAVPVGPGDELAFLIAYRSRGMDEWRFTAARGVSSLENFQLTLRTDFEAIDFPSHTMSPSSKVRDGAGWRLDWRFDRVVTSHGIGMTMPSQIQPGELAASLAFSAPISLFFFFLVIFVLGTLRKLDIHPINYLFLGGAFFAFHLLFAYSVDHIQVVPAFALSSAVSVFLVVTYLRLAVSPRFAFVEAGLAQLVYLVGFSLAHFWDGFTGLTVTVLSIITLFLLMQLTGRISWSHALRAERR